VIVMLAVAHDGDVAFDAVAFACAMLAGDGYAAIVAFAFLLTRAVRAAQHAGVAFMTFAVAALKSLVVRLVHAAIVVLVEFFEHAVGGGERFFARHPAIVVGVALEHAAVSNDHVPVFLIRSGCRGERRERHA
jgi:hypothetical protein